MRTILEFLFFTFAGVVGLIILLLVLSGCGTQNERFVTAGCTDPGTLITTECK